MDGVTVVATNLQLSLSDLSSDTLNTAACLGVFQPLPIDKVTPMCMDQSDEFNVRLIRGPAFALKLRISS